MKREIVIIIAVALAILSSCTFQDEIVYDADRTIAYKMHISATPANDLLVEAVNSNDGNLLEKAFGKGADPDAVDKAGSPVIALAVRNNRKEIARTLLQEGANPHIIDGGENLVLIAVQQSPGLIPDLIEAGVDVNVSSPTGSTALMIAIEKEDRESFDALLSAGAEINEQTSEGDTALLIALKKQLPDIASRLLEKGSDPLVRSADGNTGLHYAAEMNNKNLAERFIAAGVDINGVNEKKETPLRIALIRAEALILPFLKAGASIHIADENGVPLYFAYCVRTYFENIMSISDLKSTEKAQEKLIQYDYSINFLRSERKKFLNTMVDCLEDENFADVPGVSADAESFTYEGRLPKIVHNPYSEITISPSTDRAVKNKGTEDDLIQAFKTAFKDYLFSVTSSTETESKKVFDANKKEETDWANACVRDAGIDLSLFYSSLLNKELTAYLESFY